MHRIYRPYRRQAGSHWVCAELESSGVLVGAGLPAMRQVQAVSVLLQNTPSPRPIAQGKHCLGMASAGQLRLRSLRLERLPRRTHLAKRFTHHAHAARQSLFIALAHQRR
ncbi:hypothetical protein D3C76_1355740 [compost metagenome]